MARQRRIRPMLTPYDWQEGIGHRAGYVETKLAQGAPVIALSLDEGILMLTYRRHARKIYEIYDHLIFGAIGQQSDVEALRVAAIDFAHQEGYNRSEEDVTIQRVVTALSGSLKRAFADFNTAPFVARALFAEVGEGPTDDAYNVLDYDGDFTTRKGFAYCAGSDEVGVKLKEGLAGIKTKGLATSAALTALKKIWTSAAQSEGEASIPQDAFPEAVLLERGEVHENHVRRLTSDEEPAGED